MKQYSYHSLLLFHRNHLDDIHLGACHLFLMVFIEPFLKGEVHLHHYLHSIAPLFTKFGNEGSGGRFMHGVYAATANGHRKLQKFHIDPLLLGPKGRIHHHQIHSLWPQP